MLARPHRLTTSADFTRTSRTGARAGSRTLVAHLLLTRTPTRVGFVVSKAVGNAVVRNRVKRRLRHLASARLATLPEGILVVRALPASAEATSEELGVDLDRCLHRVMR